MQVQNEASQPLLLTIPEVAKCLRISRAKAYVLVSRKVLPCVHVGRSKRVRKIVCLLRARPTTS